MDFEPKKCPLCGGHPVVENYGVVWSAYCPECYDGAPDSSTRNMVGSDLARDRAVESWNSIVDDVLYEADSDEMNGRR